MAFNPKHSPVKSKVPEGSRPINEDLTPDAQHSIVDEQASNEGHNVNFHQGFRKSFRSDRKKLIQARTNPWFEQAKALP